MGYLIWSCYQWGPTGPQTLKAIVLALGYPIELSIQTLLLKTIQT